MVDPHDAEVGALPFMVTSNSFIEEDLPPSIPVSREQQTSEEEKHHSD